MADAISADVVIIGSGISGAMLAAGRVRGLSLGDAACLGTAGTLGVPVLTADRAWAALGLDIQIRQLRP